jgi:hypothetical protein
MDERTVALRPLQLFGLGVLVYGALRRSWPAALAGLAMLAVDAKREFARPEFSPLDLVSHQSPASSSS